MLNLKNFTLRAAKSYLPSRKINSNKTQGGKCLIIAGSPNMMGACLLAAKAAARVGAGYTYILSENRNFDFNSNPDFIFLGHIRKFNTIDLSNFNSIAIGPGLTQEKFVLQILRKLFKLNFKNVVIDAGALSALGQKRVPLLPTWILTPHEGELAKLLNTSAASVKAHRENKTLQAQKYLSAIVLLKGAKTLISDGHSFYQVSTGTKALAKAGSGDVLTGMIAGLLAQGLEPLPAAGLATFSHGLCSREWIKNKYDHLGLLASDLLLQIPKVFSRIRDARILSKSR